MLVTAALHIKNSKYQKKEILRSNTVSIYCWVISPFSDICCFWCVMPPLLAYVLRFCILIGSIFCFISDFRSVVNFNYVSSPKSSLDVISAAFRSFQSFWCFPTSPNDEEIQIGRPQTDWILVIRHLWSRDPVQGLIWAKSPNPVRKYGYSSSMQNGGYPPFLNCNDVT